jgi:predicted nucleotidyltransferase
MHRGETSKPSPELETIGQTLVEFPFVRVGLVFGSLAAGQATADSDADVGIAAEGPLTADQRHAVIEALGVATGRPVDLVDLLADGGGVLAQAITKGVLVHCLDRDLWGRVVIRMLAHETDFMPIYRRILQERRDAWIGQ